MKKIVKLAALVLALALLLVCAVKLVSLRGSVRGDTVPTDAPPEVSQPLPQDKPDVPEYPDMTGKLIISELMARNSASLRDASGRFPDWVELAAVSDSDISLDGWRLVQGNDSLELDGYTVGAGQRTVIYVPAGAGFKLKDMAPLKLTDPEGRVICEADIPEVQKDVSLAVCEDGTYRLTAYPSPGYDNDFDGYCRWQESLTNASPVLINEAVTYNNGSHSDPLYGECDWVELKNCSADPVSLASYSLSDSDKPAEAQAMPDVQLAPGETFLVLCSADTPSIRVSANDHAVSFNLNSESEDLYLFCGGEIVDSVSLTGIPLGGSYGRLDGENGFWYFAVPTPGADNRDGARAVADEPVSSAAAGIYPADTQLLVELDGEGTVYYTLDTSAPDSACAVYTGPITITESTVVRAYAVADGKLPSRSVTFNYLIGVEHELPVVCVNTDSTQAMRYIYQTSNKTERIPANIAYFDGSDGFTANCTVSMNGGTSLELPKKSMLIRLKGAYGMGSLDYDLFGDGRTGLTQLVLRVGQDYYNAAIRNELCQRLAAELSDDVLTQRGRWCVLYLNGEYYGLYALKEDDDAHLYSDRYGVSEDSVSIARANVQTYSPLYDTFDFILSHDMSSDENYEYLCENLLDIDSFTDWLVIEGWSCNPDLLMGNLKYARSAEDDGRLRLIFYDLDASLSRTGFLYSNILDPAPDRRNQIYFVSTYLLQNAQFRDKFLTRVAEALRTALSDEHVLALIDEMTAEIDSEMQRDTACWWRSSYTDWVNECDRLRGIMDGYHSLVIDRLTYLLAITPEEAEHYFGDLLS